MEKFTSNGNIYYYFNGRVTDEHFLEVPIEEAHRALLDYYSYIDYKKLSEEEMLWFIKELKNAELYNKCIEVAKYRLHIFSADYDKTVYPIITSCYRLIGQPQNAIDFFLANKSDVKCFRNSAMLTSIAAAYVDTNNLEMAEKYKKQAFAITYSNNKQPDEELISLASRLRKEQGLK